MINEEIIKKIVEKIEPKERNDFLIKLKTAFWGEKRALLQENILDRYDNVEYWNEEQIK